MIPLTYVLVALVLQAGELNGQSVEKQDQLADQGGLTAAYALVVEQPLVKKVTDGLSSLGSIPKQVSPAPAAIEPAQFRWFRADNNVS